MFSSSASKIVLVTGANKGLGFEVIKKNFSKSRLQTMI